MRSRFFAVQKSAFNKENNLTEEMDEVTNNFSTNNHFLKNPLCTGQLVKCLNISFNCHLDGSSKGLEDGFDFMVLVNAFGFDVQVAFSRVTEGLEEVVKHFCRHFP